MIVALTCERHFAIKSPHKVRDSLRDMLGDKIRDRLRDKIRDWLIAKQRDRLRDWLIDWLIDRLRDWLGEFFQICFLLWVNFDRKKQKQNVILRAVPRELITFSWRKDQTNKKTLGIIIMFTRVATNLICALFFQYRVHLRITKWWKHLACYVVPVTLLSIFFNIPLFINLKVVNWAFWNQHKKATTVLFTLSEVLDARCHLPKNKLVLEDAASPDNHWSGSHHSFVDFEHQNHQRNQAITGRISWKYLSRLNRS